MSAIVIQSKSKNNLKLLGELAKKIGEQVTILSEGQIEDLALGNYMKKIRTGKNVPTDVVLKKLRSIK